MESNWDIEAEQFHNQIALQMQESQGIENND